MQKILLSGEAFEDLVYWANSDLKILKRIFSLIKEIKRDPFKGIGKPEPLKYNLKGCWSRQINDEHRIVYQIFENNVIILSCRYHY